MPRNEKWPRTRGWIRKDTRIGPVLNIKVCYRDDRYSVEVQVPSLFQDNTVSWVRIVNGVDKYATESMPTAKEEDIASEKNIAEEDEDRTTTETLTSVSIPVLERKWIDIEHISVLECQKHSPDCYEVINQSLEEATERPTTVTSSKSAGSRSSTTLRNDYLKIGF